MKTLNPDFKKLMAIGSPPLGEHFLNAPPGVNMIAGRFSGYQDFSPSKRGIVFMDIHGIVKT